MNFDAGIRFIVFLIIFGVTNYLMMLRRYENDIKKKKYLLYSKIQNEIKLIICFHYNLRGKYLFSLFIFDMFFLFVYFFSIRHVFS